MTVQRPDQLYTFASQAGFTGQSRDTIVAISQAETGGNMNNPAAWFSGAYQTSSGGTDFTSWKSYKSGSYTNYIIYGGPGYTAPNAAGTQPSANIITSFTGRIMKQVSDHSMLLLFATIVGVLGFVIMTRRPK